MISQISLYTPHDPDNALSYWLFGVEDHAKQNGKEIDFGVDDIEKLYRNGMKHPQDIIDLIHDGEQAMLVGILTVMQVHCIKKFVMGKTPNIIDEDDDEDDEDVEGDLKDDKDDKTENDLPESNDKNVDKDGFSLDDIDGWVYDNDRMSKIEKGKRVTMGFGCASSLCKELIFIANKYEERSAEGETKQKGPWIHRVILGGSNSTLRRKKPALKLLAWDHNEWIASEKEFKYSKDGYMNGDHLVDVKRRTKQLIDSGNPPVNKGLYEKYVDVYGDAPDRDLMKELMDNMQSLE